MLKHEIDSEVLISATAGPNGLAHIRVELAGKLIVHDLVELRSAVDRKRCCNVIQKAIPALSEDEIEAQLLEIDPSSLPELGCGDAESWAEPIPVERQRLPEFPLDSLPAPLREWVGSVSYSTQTPVALPALLGIAACSGMVARRIEIETGRNGYCEPVNLYVATLMEPGTRKSDVFRLTFAPLDQLEKESVEAAKPEFFTAMAERRMLEAASKIAEKKASSGNAAARKRALKLAEELGRSPLPTLPRLWMDDTGAEAVENELARQGGRLIVRGVEGGLFEVLAGRYTNGAGNFDVFQKGHACDDLRVDRISRSVSVDRCCLTVAYAIQPEVVRGMAANKAFRGKGLIGRFLFGMPDSPLGNRLIETDPVPNSVAADYRLLTRRLWALGNAVGEKPQVLRIADEALLEWQSWKAEVETMLGDGGLLQGIRDWGGKLVGLSARLAAVFHLIATDHPKAWEVPVGPPAIRSAIEVARWSIPHAQAAIGLLAGETRLNRDLSFLFQWLRRRRLPDFSRRDFHQAARAQFDGEPERLRDALSEMIECGWIRRIAPSERSVGRPSERYAVHPSLWSDASKGRPPGTAPQD